MEYYINAIRAAAEGCEPSELKPSELKPMLDFYIEQAHQDYKGGALDVTEYLGIVDEYADTLKVRNAVNYM